MRDIREGVMRLSTYNGVRCARFFDWVSGE
jgi:hypothetical protein